MVLSQIIKYWIKTGMVDHNQLSIFILQKKAKYVPVLQAIEGKVKAEVRILAVWPEKDENPTLIGNLVRLSRGDMIGVKFNKDKDWVGGTIGMFEK